MRDQHELVRIEAIRERLRLHQAGTDALRDVPELREG